VSGPDAPQALELKQQVTRVSGTARHRGREVALENVKLRGEQLSFRLAGREFAGTVGGASIQGQGGAWSAQRVR
jgi:hypothetical protein